MTHDRERRRATRVPCRQPVQLQHGGFDHPVSGLAEDISATGLRVAAPSSIEAGQRVLCSLLLQDQSVEAACRVVWVRRGDQSHPIAGLEFEELGRSEATSLQRFIARLSTNLQVGSLLFDPCCTSGTWAPEYLLGEDTVEQPPPQRRAPAVSRKLLLTAAVLLATALVTLFVLQARLF